MCTKQAGQRTGDLEENEGPTGFQEVWDGEEVGKKNEHKNPRRIKGCRDGK